MPLIPFASNFLAGSLISLLMPVGLLIALAVWYTRSVKRIPGSEAERSELPVPGAEPPPVAGGAPDGPPGGHP